MMQPVRTNNHLDICRKATLQSQTCKHALQWVWSSCVDIPGPPDPVSEIETGGVEQPPAEGGEEYTGATDTSRQTGRRQKYLVDHVAVNKASLWEWACIHRGDWVCSGVSLQNPS